MQGQQYNKAFGGVAHRDHRDYHFSGLILGSTQTHIIIYWLKLMAGQSLPAEED